MSVRVERLPKSRVKLTVEISAERMADFFDASYAALAAGVEIAGFRRGQAPPGLVRERLGVARITSEAADRAVTSTYQESLTKEELIPVAAPKIEILAAGENQPLEYVAEVDVLPTVTLPRYEKIRLSPKKFAPEPVKPAAVQEALLNLRRRLSQVRPVDRLAAKGDLVEVSYLGKVGGVAQEGLQSQRHPLILGEGTMLPAFEESLVGMTKGERRTVTIDVPGRGGPARATEFNVTLLSVAELAIPEFTNEFARRFNKSSAVELTRAVEADLKLHAESAARQRLEQAVLDEIIRRTKIELPESLIEREITHRLETLREQLRRSGRELEDFFASRGQNLEAVRQEIRPSAARTVTTSLVLRAIAEREGFIKPGRPATEEALKKTVDHLVALTTKVNSQ